MSFRIADAEVGSVTECMRPADARDLRVPLELRLGLWRLSEGRCGVRGVFGAVLGGCDCGCEGELIGASTSTSVDGSLALAAGTAEAVAI